MEMEFDYELFQELTRENILGFYDVRYPYTLIEPDDNDCVFINTNETYRIKTNKGEWNLIDGVPYKLNQ